MIGQRWHVYPTTELRALEASHVQPEDTYYRIHKAQAECYLCARGWCEQRIEHAYPDIVNHAKHSGAAA